MREEPACDWLRAWFAAEAYYPVAQVPVLHKGAPTGAMEERPAWGGYIVARFPKAPDWQNLEVCSHVVGRGWIPQFSHDDVIDDETGQTEAIYKPQTMREAEIWRIRIEEAAGKFKPAPLEELCKAYIGVGCRIPFGFMMGKTGKVQEVEPCPVGILGDSIASVSARLIKNAKPTRLSFKLCDLFPDKFGKV